MSDLLTQLNQGKPTKFVDATAGSTVTISRGGETPWRGTVTHNLPEHGSTGLPALYVLPEGKDEPELVVGNGRVRLTIERAVARATTPVHPADAWQITPKPTPSIAVQFTGGYGSAGSIIRWASGYSAVSYLEAPEDALLLPGGNGSPDSLVYPGDFVVCTPGNVFVKIEANRVAEQFDVVEASRASL